jgi:cytochrome c551/c552
MQTTAARNVVALLACAWSFAVAGCAGDPGPSCVVVKTDCQPLYDPPTYTAIFDKIFQPTCASGRGTCHTSDAKMGGLFFQDSAQAYQLLLGKTDGRARVIPDNPGCSLLAERLASSDPAFEMPPGARLSDAELCTVMKWLGAGAPSGP